MDDPFDDDPPDDDPAVSGSASMSARDAIRSPVCTDSVEPSCVMVPPGMSEPLSCRASEIAVCDSPRAASSERSGVMTTRRPGLP